MLNAVYAVMARAQAPTQMPISERDLDNQLQEHVTKGKNPLKHIGNVTYIASFLSFEDLKNARMINRFWYSVTRDIWKEKSQIVLKHIVGIRKFATETAGLPRPMVLPLTVNNWVFKGETVFKLMNAEGHCERHLLGPFFPSIRNLTFSEWTRKRWRYERMNGAPNPLNPNHANNQNQLWRTSFDDTTRKGSSYHVMDLFRLCTNLTTLEIHFPLLARIKGAYIGPRQFPELETLRRFDIYYGGKRFDSNLTAANFNELLMANITNGAVGIELPTPRRETTVKTGGETLILRILDHSPNLTYFSVDSDTLITNVVENWVANLLARQEKVTTRRPPRPLAPRLTHLVFSIPLKETICEGLPLRKWRLKSLHLRSMFGEDHRVNAKQIHHLISGFSETLEHLELVFLMKNDDRSQEFHSSRNLYQLQSLELWGYTGSFNFLKDLRKLRSAVIGATELDGVGTFDGIKEHFERNPLRNVDVQVLSQADFFQRLNEGPKLPYKVL